MGLVESARLNIRKDSPFNLQSANDALIHAEEQLKLSIKNVNYLIDIEKQIELDENL